MDYDFARGFNPRSTMILPLRGIFEYFASPHIYNDDAPMGHIWTFHTPAERAYLCRSGVQSPTGFNSRQYLESSSHHPRRGCILSLFKSQRIDRLQIRRPFGRQEPREDSYNNGDRKSGNNYRRIDIHADLFDVGSIYEITYQKAESYGNKSSKESDHNGFNEELLDDVFI